MRNGGWGDVVSASAHELRNALLEKLEAIDVESLASEQLGDELKFIRSTVDLFELQATRRLTVFDSRQTFYDLDKHSSVDWIRANTHVSAASADSQVTLAHQLETLKPTVEAVEQGEISFEHALLIARQVSDLPEATAQQAQAELLPAAAKSDPRGLRKLGLEIRHREDRAS